jgi:hypothetical protein
MSNRLGPLDVRCDAPSYKIVQACRKVGVRNPEDVRWVRMKQILARRPQGERTCSCGHQLPLLEKVIFTFTSGDEVMYLIGQCSGCHTVFWEDEE